MGVLAVGGDKWGVVHRTSKLLCSFAEEICLCIPRVYA